VRLAALADLTWPNGPGRPSVGLESRADLSGLGGPVADRLSWAAGEDWQARDPEDRPHRKPLDQPSPGLRLEGPFLTAPRRKVWRPEESGTTFLTQRSGLGTIEDLLQLAEPCGRESDRLRPFSRQRSGRGVASLPIGATST